VLEQIVTITSSLGIRTHRADIVMEKTAAAIAALDGRRELSRQDVVDAALLALPHRMRQKPFEKDAPLDREHIESTLDQQVEQELPDAFERSGEIKKKL
jgi:magnesium chelatase subunit D